MNDLTISALRETLLAVLADLCDAALAADPALLARENPYPPTQAPFPTAAEFVAYLLTVHFAYHVGQLTIWRCCIG